MCAVSVHARRPPLLEVTRQGLYCAAGDFHVDPWAPVPRAVITHGHADHARRGSAAYLAAPSALSVLRVRLGPEAILEGLPWGERRRFGEVDVSLHPAGHLLGSAQVRIEHRGEVWVVSGDYKTDPDPTCEPFEAVRCDTFITESTFGLPVFRWPAQRVVLAEIVDWWRANAAAERPTVLFAYALGKSQRLLAGIAAVDAAREIGPLVVHGAVRVCVDAYRAAGVALPEVAAATELSRDELRRALVIAPPSAQGSPWMRRFPRAATGFVSGWMRLRALRRQRRVDRGFVLSDHVDWPGVVGAIEATGAARVGVTHGYMAALARWLREERGIDAWTLRTRFTGEAGAEETAVESAAEAGIAVDAEAVAAATVRHPADAAGPASS
ncbi:MAG TPA: ligase-associated DNA damage response exonuclease [Thermoanaerobaculia bacterium]|jgi:putative mRNA 3-end processing factor|nr:ligase-associated DNA damage response exonuclease [Thermoanaerobaculia bacterium]